MACSTQAWASAPAARCGRFRTVLERALLRLPVGVSGGKERGSESPR